LSIQALPQHPQHLVDQWSLDTTRPHGTVEKYEAINILPSKSPHSAGPWGPGAWRGRSWKSGSINVGTRARDGGLFLFLSNTVSKYDNTHRIL